jgi:hypothetical protein
MAILPVDNDLDFQGSARAFGLPNPTTATDAATKAYVDSAVEGLAWKDGARVATQGNTNLAAPGASIDGIAMVVNDRVLVRAQTTGTENGIYIWNGAAAAMTRALDASTFDELEQAVLTVEEGSSAGTTFRQTAVNGTLGSTTVTFSSFGTGAPSATETTAGIAELATQAETDAGTDDQRIVTPFKGKTASWAGKRASQTIGDGSATNIIFNHGLGTEDVEIYVRETGGAKRQRPFVVVEHTSTSQVTLRFNTAPALNTLRVTAVA